MAKWSVSGIRRWPLPLSTKFIKWSWLESIREETDNIIFRYIDVQIVFLEIVDLPIQIKTGLYQIGKQKRKATEQNRHFNTNWYQQAKRQSKNFHATFSY